MSQQCICIAASTLKRCRVSAEPGTQLCKFHRKCQNFAFSGVSAVPECESIRSYFRSSAQIQTELQAPPLSKEQKTPKLFIKDFGDKVGVYGDTFVYLKQLKSMGGKWDPKIGASDRLKGCCFVFPKEDLPKLEKMIKGDHSADSDEPEPDTESLDVFTNTEPLQTDGEPLFAAKYKRAIVVYGSSHYDDALREIGGKFNGRLKTGDTKKYPDCCWIFKSDMMPSLKKTKFTKTAKR